MSARVGAAGGPRSIVPRPTALAAGQPVLGGTRANDYTNDLGNYKFTRVDQWT